MDNVLEQKGLGQIEEQKKEREQAAGLRQAKRTGTDGAEGQGASVKDTVAQDQSNAGRMRALRQQKMFAKKQKRWAINKGKKLAKKTAKQLAKMGLRPVIAGFLATGFGMIAAWLLQLGQVFVGNLMGNEEVALEGAIDWGSFLLVSVVLGVIILVILYFLVILQLSFTDAAFSVKFWGSQIFK